MSRFLFLLALTAALPAFPWPGSAETTGSAAIEGRVAMQDAPRARRRSRQYARAQGEEVAPRPPDLAVVYLTGPGVKPGVPDPRPQASLEQRGLQFFPSVLPVQVGTEVFFPNLDDTFHNVFSYSPVGTFDKGRYKRGEVPPSEIFEQPGEIQVFCEVHDHMRATILVLDTPIFAATDEAGRFRIDGVPPGTYTLHVWWNPRAQTEQSITLISGETLKVEIDPES